MSTNQYILPAPPRAREALAALLGHGPMDSQAALESLVAEGFTPKQVRGAREHLDIVVTRHGFGKAARSSWTLPSPADMVDRSATAAAAAMRPDPEPSQALPTGSQVSLRTRRVAFFVLAGMSAQDAANLAGQCGQRDEDGSRRVSCAECQNSTRKEWCNQVRPYLEMHNCESARPCAP